MKAVVFPYSRFVCDVERSINSSFEQNGQGIIYTQYDGYKRNPLSTAQKEQILGLWNAHQDRLKEELGQGGVLLDCHSFSGTADDKDICIGFNDDEHYGERLVSAIVAVFEKYGYSVSLNSPYSGTIAPNAGVPYSSVMINIKKRLYLYESLLTLERSQYQCMRWFGCIKKVYEAISNNG